MCFRSSSEVGSIAVGAGETPTEGRLAASLRRFLFLAGVAKFLVEEGDGALAELEDQAEISVVGSLFGSELALDTEEGDSGKEAVDLFRGGESASGCG